MNPIQNTISLKKYGYTPNCSENLNLETYIYIVKAKKNATTLTINKDIPEDYIKQVKDYLAKEHKELIKESFGDELKKKALSIEVSKFITTLPPQPGYTHEQLTKGVVDAIAGLDVLEVFGVKESVTDIICNDYDDIWITDLEDGEYKSNIKFKSRGDYQALCNKFVNASGQSWTHTKPEVDASFPNMRINMMGFDISQDGISLAIRKFSKKLRISEESMIQTKQADEKMIALLKAIVKARCSIVIAGATGTGKTELLKWLVGFINERVLMIQDTNETFLKDLYPHKNIKTWNTREREEEADTIRADRLVRSALRQFPHWLLISESRGKEMWYTLKAASTDHAIITTIHGDGAANVPERITDMCLEAVNMSEDSLMRRVTKAFNIVIHVEKMLDGRRRIVEIAEYTGYKDGEVQYTTLFSFNTTNVEESVNRNGHFCYKIDGYHEQTGFLSSEIVKRFKRYGALTDETKSLVKGEELIGIC